MYISTNDMMSCYAYFFVVVFLFLFFCCVVICVVFCCVWVEGMGIDGIDGEVYDFSLSKNSFLMAGV